MGKLRVKNNSSNYGKLHYLTDVNSRNFIERDFGS